MTSRIDEMEVKLTDLQEVIDQHVSDRAAAFSDSSCTRKRKRKTPLSLQV